MKGDGVRASPDSNSPLPIPHSRPFQPVARFGAAPKRPAASHETFMTLATSYLEDARVRCGHYAPGGPPCA